MNNIEHESAIMELVIDPVISCCKIRENCEEKNNCCKYRMLCVYTLPGAIPPSCMKIDDQIEWAKILLKERQVY